MAFLGRRPPQGWALLLWLWPAVAASLCAQPSREYDLKAAFLYNFAAFVDWPPAAFERSDEPFVIGVFGNDPFGPVLDEIVAGERAKDRPLLVRRTSRLEDIADCHILFVCASEAHRVRDILRHAAGGAVLTVSDVPGFAQAGGIVGFTTEGGRLVLHVNAPAAAAAELVISSKLLRVARLVRPGGMQ